MVVGCPGGACKTAGHDDFLIGAFTVQITSARQPSATLANSAAQVVQLGRRQAKSRSGWSLQPAGYGQQRKLAQAVAAHRRARKT
eukprot:CAMPEP_0170253042 /NCGR_PEP_ID=MMETSP0116_2-20130129/26358_1 /TAXON_ID=400756 /ORGANISM="Durinskia baltica, Strain CSIRO CS-38" /LENGTH=84 /DNA_ID=CAMNT_0010504019 /DNA_START=416 /DNA_END=670 /DNA_ORIENTATION=-